MLHSKITTAKTKQIDLKFQFSIAAVLSENLNPNMSILRPTLPRSLQKAWQERISNDSPQFAVLIYLQHFEMFDTVRVISFSLEQLESNQIIHLAHDFLYFYLQAIR